MLTLLAGSPGFTCTLRAACGVVCLGTVANAGSPGEWGAVLVADPLHYSAGLQKHVFRLPLSIPRLMPLCCKVWPQDCQGVAYARTAASTEGAAVTSKCSDSDLSLPLVELPTAAGPAEPPSHERGPKRHAGWGLVPIFAGVPLLHQLWPAAQGRMTTSCTQDIAPHED